MRQFPHLPDAPADWPGPGRELYEQIPGNFDSGEWQEGATITMLSVPWGVYDATTQTDVPGFDSAAERDEWFKNYLVKKGNIESHVLDTYVRYQLKGTVDLPFTFDYAARYNYMIVDYPTAPVDYGTKGLKRWFFHVTAIDYDSPSCTRVTITPDWWTTCAPLMTINHMILERGHAPVALSDVDSYLADPINNSDYLLAADVDFGNAERTAHSADLVFNDGQIYAVFCMRGIDLTGDFSGYKMSATAQVTFTDGQLTSWQCAVKVQDLATFLANMHTQAPQAIENIEALFLAGEKILALGSEVAIFGCAAWLGPYGKRAEHTFELNKEAFGFDAKFADLAKLYTSPYSHIEVADERGQVTRINVEELHGKGLTVSYSFNAAFPWLKLSASFGNVGGASRYIRFANVNEHDMLAGGSWYNTLREWGVPCFKVCQVASEGYDYQAHYDIEQRKKNAETAYTNTTASIDTAYNNAIASNDAAYNNAVASNNTAYNNAIDNAYCAYENAMLVNSTAQTNANNNAVLVTSNNAVTTTLSTNLVTIANTYASAAKADANNKIDADGDADKAFASDSYTAEVAGLAVAATNNQTSFAASATQVVSSALTGASAGAAVGSIPGALTGMAAGLALPALNFATTAASNAVSQSNSNLMWQASLDSITSKTKNAKTYADEVTENSNSMRSDSNSKQVAASETLATNNANNINTNAANTKAAGDTNAARSQNAAKTCASRALETGNSNADRTKTTADANADRSKFTDTGNAQRTRSNAFATVQAAIDNAGMQVSAAYGMEQGGDYSSTRPQVLSVNVITESKNAIAQAGAQFKRWGYTLNQSFDFSKWCLMPHFTFWQVADLWATGTGEVPEEGQDAVRNMLYSGVTCWKDPAEIGKVSIYDN